MTTPSTSTAGPQAMMLRDATINDLHEINEIYNHYVLNSTCTYQIRPESIEARRRWFEHHGPQHPVVVAEQEGQIIAWGSLSRFHAREAFCKTVEHSIYVHPEHRRRGLGAAILDHLIGRARELGYHSMVALIDGEQEPSLELQKKFGFYEVGRLREVGQKFGRWLDMVYMQLIL